MKAKNMADWRKRGIPTIAAIVVLACGALVMLNQYQQYGEQYVYVLDKGRCALLFNESPEKAADGFVSTEDLSFRKVYVNDDGDFVLILSEFDRKTWVTNNKLLIFSVLEDAAERDDAEIFISNDFRTIECHGNVDSAWFIMFSLMKLISGCAGQQIFHGVPPEDVYLDITLKNIDSGRIIWKGKLPGDMFSIDSADWHE